MLDAIRYMVVWNPIILLGLHVGLRLLGMEKHQQQQTLAVAGADLNITMGTHATLADSVNSTL